VNLRTRQSLHIGARALGFMLCMGSALAAVTGGHPAFAAEKVSLGVLRFSSNVPEYIAVDRGYFAAEGLDVTLVDFDAGQPVAVATLSGDIDFGAAGITSALYQMAAQGGLRIIGGSSNTSPGFHTSAALISEKAYAAGLRSPKDIGGHSVAITQVGSTYHYAYSLMAEKYGVDLKSIRLLPLQSMGNVAAALVGGQADTAVLNTSLAEPLVRENKAKMLAWTDEEVSFQVAAIWTSTKTANERPETVQRFLRGLRRAGQDYAAAFIGEDGKPTEGPDAKNILELVGKRMHQPIEQVRLSLGYYEPQARLDLADVQHQLDWYYAQGMLKSPFKVDQIIDARAVLPLKR
jgi:NitT/TauT family transport system substrate-binding protein